MENSAVNPLPHTTGPGFPAARESRNLSADFCIGLHNSIVSTIEWLKLIAPVIYKDCNLSNERSKHFLSTWNTSKLNEEFIEQDIQIRCSNRKNG
jgi:hypothetical protein